MLSHLIDRPVAGLLSFAAALVLGLLALRALPVSLLPEVDIPRIDVRVAYPDTEARDLERGVVHPLREALLQVNGLEDIRSRTRDEAAVLTLDFPFGTDADLAFIEVNEKLDRALGRLPRDLERPLVLPADLADIPVLHLVVALPDSVATPARRLELSELGRNVLRRRLEQLATVAFVDITGTLDPEIAVAPRPEVLRGLGLTAALRGTEDVIRPLVASALTTCAVFLPLVLLSGLAGSLFRDQALSVTLALAASLVTAYALLPLLSRLVGGAAGGTSHRTGGRRAGERAVDALLRRPVPAATLNVVSLIGMVVTGGIVVNDAILKVDLIRRLEAEPGVSRREAIHRAGERRLRAIVMTSLTTILALGPVLFASGLGAELQAPLAAAVIGGLLCGTLVSVYLTPGFYQWMIPGETGGRYFLPG